MNAESSRSGRPKTWRIPLSCPTSVWLVRYAYAWMAVAIAVVIGFFPCCHAAEKERFVVDNTVMSRRDPAGAIRLPRSLHYIGADRFLLTDPKLGDFDVCELYAFVDADNDRHVFKFYWVQFEAYLPSHPDLHHTYASPRNVIIDGLDFYVDTGVSSADRSPKSASDEAHFYSLLASKGYRHDDLMYVRLVHLIDSAKRKELMIIYAESLAPTGYTAPQLGEGGSEHAKWGALAGKLAGKAERNITITIRKNVR